MRQHHELRSISVMESWRPDMIEHRCSVGERGGFFQRLDIRTYPPHILEQVALELQTMAE
jgi:cyanophycin synthetase